MWTKEIRDKSIEAVKLKALNNHKANSRKHTSNHALKKILETAGREYVCSACGINEWQGKALTLELEHKDGDSFNNDLDNLEYLCPNCHSQTKTFRGRNINTGKKKVSDEELISALNETKNIRQALIHVGLSPRGGNYSRASKLLAGMA